MKQGCLHYRSPLDIVSIRFKCCGVYYPCFFCHEEASGHAPLRWARADFETKAILCRNCEKEGSIWDYLLSGSRCLYCKAPFNAGCKLHWNLYFDLGEDLPVARSKHSSNPGVKES